MASVQIARDEMLKRVAHFKELKPIDYQALGMGSIPEGMTGFSLIGQVGKNLTPAIPGDHGFTVGLAKVSPGKGSPPHTHTTVEVFIPFSANGSSPGAPRARRRRPSWSPGIPFRSRRGSCMGFAISVRRRPVFWPFWVARQWARSPMRPRDRRGQEPRGGQ